MTRGQNKWIGPIVEEAIERVAPGIWYCELSDQEEAIKVSIVKSSTFGPYLVVACGKICQKAARRLVSLRQKMTSGVLIFVEFADDPIPALEHLELRTIIDEADEVIVAGPAGCVIWDRLSNKRFRAVDEEALLSEAIASMQNLDLLPKDGATQLAAMLSEFRMTVH